mgnify:CR=1 FL=1
MTAEIIISSIILLISAAPLVMINWDKGKSINAVS